MQRNKSGDASSTFGSGESSHRSWSPLTSRSLPFLLSGIALGGALAYFGDPDRGARRRAEVRQRGVHLQKVASRRGGRALRDLAARSRGLLHRVPWAKSRPADERVVHERVRSMLGRLVEEPAAIRVEVKEGDVTLRGRVRAEELSLVLACVRQVKGVRSVRHEVNFVSEFRSSNES